MEVDSSLPYIVEDDEYKFLHFNEWDIQSKMRKSAPDELVLSYTHAMAGFMLFQPAPRHVLVVGLGGGSLSKFCYRHLPEAQITTVEISQPVIDLRDEFRIPADDDRFRVVHADIAAYLDGDDRADVILLDGYDSRGVPEGMSDAKFYARCVDALTDTGILVANINLGAMSSTVSARHFRAVFGAGAISIRSAAGHNDILFGFRDTGLPEVAVLKKRALALRKETGIDFPLILDKLRSGAAANAAEGGDAEEDGAGEGNRTLV